MKFIRVRTMNNNHKFRVTNPKRIKKWKSLGSSFKNSVKITTEKEI